MEPLSVVLRIQLGHNVCKSLLTLPERLYDPVVRNLGNLKTGAGVPIVSGLKDEGLSLYRDNIFFFANSGGTSFAGSSNRHFENPLAANQFTQVTVNGIDAIAQDANLFFNTGTYIVNPTSASAPNANITLPAGQSIYGRSLDYRRSAVGAERPTFLGSLTLTGNNTLDSIIVTNVMTSSGAIPVILNTLTIEGAPNVVICNSEINAILDITGDNNTVLQVSAIHANDSNVTIDKSVINASTTIAGNDNLISMITGIGGNSAGGNNSDVVGNRFKINNSILKSRGVVHGNIENANSSGQTAVNYVTNIGGNEFLGSANLENNIFKLNSCILDSLGSVGQNMEGSAVNYVTNIGGNDDSQLGVLFPASSPTGITSTGSAIFQSNEFFLTACSLNSTASVAQNMSFSANAAANIGGNALADPSSQGTNFNLNSFTLNSCDLNSLASVGGDEIGENGNFATAIGGNEVIGNSSFNQNVFSITSCNLQSVALVSSLVSGGNIDINSATVIGGNAFGGNVSFNSNDFFISESSLNSLATVGSNNVAAENFATVIGGNAVDVGNADFDNNSFLVDSCFLVSTARIGADNSGLNFAIGIGGNANGASAAFNNNVFTVSNSTVNVLSNVINTNTGINQAIGWQAVSGTVNLLSNQFFITAVRGVGTPSTAIAKIPGAAIVNDATTIYIVSSQ